MRIRSVLLSGLAALVAVGGGTAGIVAASASATPKAALAAAVPSMRLAGGQAENVNCSGTNLQWTNTGANSGQILCMGSPPPPTTTTVPPASTTTTVPSTTTTGPTTSSTVPAQPSSCRFASAPAPTAGAFCQNFAAVTAGAQPRSPSLPADWGVSRMMGNTNTGQGQYNAAIPTPDPCGSGAAVSPPNDVKVCGGLLADSVTDGVGFDNGTVTSVAMYPKQPFDFAGRTGTISFDVSDDSEGNHRAWPELWLGDGPEPDPFTHFSSWQATPKDGFGLRFDGCGSSSFDLTGVASAVVVNNYVSNDSFAGDFGNGSINVAETGCMTRSSGPGNMNHIEVRVGANTIDVYGTNAGDTGGTLIHLGHITGFNLSLTRGIVWLEDVHYNGNKAGCPNSEPCTPKDPTAQGTHTFTWNNVGFDGPVLAKDLTFDAADNTTRANNGWPNLGYPVGTAPNNVTVPNVVIPPQATTAALLFNYIVSGSGVPITYSVNGGAPQTYAGNFSQCYVANGSTQCSNRTAKVPVPLSDLVAGANTVHFSGSGIDVVTNVDILLPGAG